MADCSIVIVIMNQQFGFRILHLTGLALSKCTSNWWLNMDRGNMNSAVFLDIRKVFDTVSHQILSDKLHWYGIGDGELLFFRSYLQNRTQCCSVNRQISTLQKVSCGVPQGSIFGPLLFIIYMNDLPAFVQKANITSNTMSVGGGRDFSSSSKCEYCHQTNNVEL